MRETQIVCPWRVKKTKENEGKKRDVRGFKGKKRDWKTNGVPLKGKLVTVVEWRMEESADITHNLAG